MGHTSGLWDKERIPALDDDLRVLFRRDRTRNKASFFFFFFNFLLSLLREQIHGHDGARVPVLGLTL